jgi:hypothetical protein
MSNSIKDKELRSRLHDALDTVRPAAGVEQRVMERVRPQLDRAMRGTRWQPLRTTLGGALAALAVVVLIGGSFGIGLALRSHIAAPAAPGKHTPQISPPTSPTKPPATQLNPPPAAEVSSTITAPAPLLVTWDPTSEMGSAPSRYIARDYQGHTVGTLTLDQTSQAWGVSIAPDGSKLLIAGRLIYDIYGHRLADIYSAGLTNPIWADDSNHLCGVSGGTGASGTGAVLEVSAGGVVHEVAHLGPGAWFVLACSPGADRAVVSNSTGPITEMTQVVVLRLSTGQVLASYPGWSGSVAVATHDGRLVAVDDANGISIRDLATGRQLAWIVRWGSQAGFPVIGVAVDFSWDGTRLLVDAGGAGGATHPRYIVAWATNTNVVTNATAGSTQLEVVVPLTRGSTFLVEEPVSPYRAYFLESDGILHRLP